MIGTSTAEWVFIRISIVAFRFMPLFYAIGIAVQYSRHGASAWSLAPTWILYGLLIAEAVFYVFAWRPFQTRLKLPADHPDPLSRVERQELFDKCLVNTPSMESYLRGWFLGANLSDIRRENVREFLLWGFFDMDVTEVDHDAHAIDKEIDGYISKIEKGLGKSLPQGRGPAKSLRLTLDGAETAYRGLAWYTVVFFADQFTHMFLAWHGFQYHAHSPGNNGQIFPPRPQNLVARRHSPAPNLSYWFQPHECGADTLPVVFFHGIGIGLLPYIRFLIDVHAAQNRNGKGVGILAIEVLPISFRLTAPPLARSEFVHQMAAILDHHGWDNFGLVSHSYGSVLTTHMLNDPAMQRRVSSVVLIDPVTIMLHLPHVAYNFTRRGPNGANEWQLWYFASTDPGVAHCLSRHFFWRQNIIWRDQLVDSLAGETVQGTRRVAVCLSGRDLIVDTPSVAQYLSTAAGRGKNSSSTGDSTDIEVAIFPDLDHAQVFDDPASFKKVVQLVRSYCTA